jgi:RNA polymerase sporulation-specific sigma factor
MEKSEKEQSQRYENHKILEYVERFKKDSGDEEAFAEIIKALHSFLQHLALKKFFYVAGHSSEDIYQEGLYALSTKAIPDYDIEKGPFLSFAKLCIRRHIITVLKSANNYKNKALNMSVSLDATVCNDDDDGPVSIGGFLPNEDEDVVIRVLRCESHRKLKTLLMSRLTELESKVLKLYLKNLSYMDIVESLNKRRRGRNRLKPKVIDNALCRIKKKAMELEEQIETGQKIQMPIFFEDYEDGGNGVSPL